MKVALFALTGLALLAAGAAKADDDTMKLLQKSGCTACHSVGKKVIGPAYKYVAAKYKSDAGAEAKLAEKVKKGGSGVWGPVPMPPNAAVKDDDIKKMVHYIMGLKK